MIEEELRARATELLGREFEIEETTDGMFVPVFFDYNNRPPPKRETELDALEAFVSYLENREIKSLQEEAIRQTEDTVGE